MQPDSRWRKLELATLDARRRSDAFLIDWAPDARRLLVRLGVYPDVALAVVDRETEQIGPSLAGPHQVARFLDADHVGIVARDEAILRATAPALTTLSMHTLARRASPLATAVARDGSRFAMVSTFRGRGRIDCLSFAGATIDAHDATPHGALAAIAFSDDTHALRAIGSAATPLGPLLEWRSGRGSKPITKEVPLACALSADGSTIAVVEAASGGILLRVLDADNFTRLSGTMPGEPSNLHLSLSADGSRLAVTLAGTGTLQVIDTYRGTEIFAYAMTADERQHVSQAHLTPDGSTLLWARRTLQDWRLAPL